MLETRIVLSVTRSPGRPRSLSVEQIVEAGLAEGLSHVTMPLVAERLGVARSGLYRYVTDRDDLVVKMLSHIALEAQWPPHDLPWRAQLTQIGETLWHLCATHPGYDLAALQTRQVSPGFVARLAPYVDSMHQQGFSVVEATSSIEFVRSLVLMSSIEANRLLAVAASDRAINRDIEGFADPEKWSGRGWYQRHLDTWLDGLALRVDQ